MSIQESELILNPNGSVYHLNLRPENVAKTIITVGDPDRVNAVTKHFDSIEFQTQKREFHSKTGHYKGKRISVISTGIGTDNIDIVFNELDALVNIDLETRTVKQVITSLDFIRIGTSGAIQKNIPIDSFLISEYAVGFDSLLHFYNCESILDIALSDAIVQQTNWSASKSKPYVVSCSKELLSRFSTNNTTITGFTATNPGFYGPQSRVLRLPLQDKNLNTKLANFKYNNKMITNLEMETAGIYGLSQLLGHQAISLNAIVANRANGEFSKQPKKTIDELILFTLNKLVE